ncbi:hypothetical protein KSD_11720 [Ktedonobacter sp. SOSP1-85]|uniref:Regulatory protein RecX n=1 Tax=Ktedonobacter robiniae TaxID=2778365 RepID=A0ABQ3UQH8_9CHLR|nr:MULTISPECIES: hypothetical protein [Ktedonobacter]GHO54954.1 hypothetical protein KSB_34290 [Ktedonobacter robiniae]GHO73401.1 hypothetical protein KSD_11720 [Ktedonobacter sp. SOSP1-85]
MPEQSYTTRASDIQRLLSAGFSEAEARKLLFMREHVDEQIEYREMLEESRRLNFIRWLLEHNRMSR